MTKKLTISTRSMSLKSFSKKPKLPSKSIKKVLKKNIKKVIKKSLIVNDKKINIKPL